MENLSFFTEDIDFQFDEIKKTSVWINKIISNYSKISGDLTYIFCSDTYLLQLNISHLNHDTLTDIITFDYTNAGIISGDIFISIDRIKENASTFGVPFEEELSRVMAHGVLHLIGFKDKTKDEKQEMREAEDHALTLVVS